MDKVAILLVLYNDAEHIPRLVESINQQTYKNIDVYAIENSVSGASVDLLKELYPNAKTFTHQGNLGFAAGNNFLAKMAFKDGADFIFILNTDMELDMSCLTELLLLFNKDVKLGGAAPIVLHGRNGIRTNEIQCYAEKIDFRTAKTVSLIAYKDYIENIDEYYEVNIIHGGASFIRKELFEKVGLFNEKNFMYGDERDFAFNINMTDYKLAVTSKAKCWHFHDRSVKNKTGYHLEYYYRLRNRHLYFIDRIMILSLVMSLLKEIFKIPIIVKWALNRRDPALIKYYYLGLFHGLIHKTGRAKIDFR